MKFVCHRLRQRRADILSNLGLARVDGDRAILRDVQPRSDFSWKRLATPPIAASGFLSVQRKNN